MKKNRYRCDRCRHMHIILRPMDQNIFLTLYTVSLDRKMLGLLKGVARKRAARWVANLLKGLPPVSKGDILLAKWEDESSQA